MDFLGAAIGATAQHISDGIGYLNQKQTNEANLEAVRLTNESNRQMQAAANAANMELAKYQNAQAYNLWREQIAEQRANEAMIRDYNSPAATMARYKAAGLNPNLIYGNSSGGATASPTPSAPSVSRANIEASRDIPGQIAPINFGSPGQTIMDAFRMMKEMELRDAQTNNLKSQAAVNEAKEQNLYANTLLAAARKLGVEQSTAFAKMMQPYQQSALVANIDLRRRQIDNVDSQIKNRTFMQNVATERLSQQWKMADVAQRRSMIESAKLALTERLVQVSEGKLDIQHSLRPLERRRLKEQIGVLEQLQQLRPAQLQLQRGNLWINAIKTGFSVGSGFGF